MLCFLVADGAGGKNPPQSTQGMASPPSLPWPTPASCHLPESTCFPTACTEPCYFLLPGSSYCDVIQVMPCGVSRSPEARAVALWQRAGRVTGCRGKPRGLTSSLSGGCDCFPSAFLKGIAEILTA